MILILKNILNLFCTTFVFMEKGHTGHFVYGSKSVQIIQICATNCKYVNKNNGYSLHKGQFLDSTFNLYKSHSFPLKFLAPSSQTKPFSINILPNFTFISFGLSLPWFLFHLQWLRNNHFLRPCSMLPPAFPFFSCHLHAHLRQSICEVKQRFDH